MVIAAVATEGSAAATLCTDQNAVKQILKLMDLETGDEISGNYPSAASPQRQAIIRGLANQYCRNSDATPQPDYQEKLDALCTLYSGLDAGERVYWSRCLTCSEAGIQCE